MSLIMKVVLLVFVAVSMATAAWPDPETCPDQCTCVNYQVSCPRATFKVLPRLPTGTQYLYMFSSALETLDKNSFANVPTLHSINIDSSALREIGPDTFTPLKSLTTLYLFGNKISKISPTAFRDSHLPKIWLWNNQLTSFELMANLKVDAIVISENPVAEIDFRSYPNMMRTSSLIMRNAPLSAISKEKLTNLDNLYSLNLDGCKIAQVDGGMFSHMTKLEYLNMKNNQLQTLPESLTPVFQRAKIEFAGNPFHCDCKMKWIKSVSTTMSIDLGTCKTPARMAGKKIADAFADDFTC